MKKKKKLKSFIKNMILLVVVFLIGFFGSTYYTYSHRFPHIPFKYFDNYFICTKRYGDCNELKGHVLLKVFFIEDEDSSWKENEIDQYKKYIDDEIDLLLVSSKKYDVNLSFSKDYQSIKVNQNLSDENFDEWTQDIASKYGYDRDDMIDDLKDEGDYDEVCPIFVFNKKGRSYTKNTSYKGFEGCFLFEKGESAFVRHELLHLFGAMDFYYPENIKKIMSNYYPASVMLEGNHKEVDEFTAYLIGWSDKVTDEMLEFLEATKEITPEKMRDEHEKENYTGSGKRTYEAGEYEGELKDGVPQGQGTMIFDDGTKYVGEWEFGKMNGTGTMTWTSGNVYTGDFKDGERTGKGKLTLPNGTVYEGDFVSGEIVGYGTCHYKDGSSYTGEWKDGLRNGKGTYTFKDGTKLSGQWKNGKHIK